jgi:hypothetical protein
MHTFFEDDFYRYDIHKRVVTAKANGAELSLTEYPAESPHPIYGRFGPGYSRAGQGGGFSEAEAHLAALQVKSLITAGKLRFQNLKDFSKQELLAFKERATETQDPPAYESGYEVEVRGEALSEPIYWTGRQWAVTAAGIECRDGTYFIAKDRIWEGEADWGWVRQMAEKTWVDVEDFVEALRLARRHWARKMDAA